MSCCVALCRVVLCYVAFSVLVGVVWCCVLLWCGVFCDVCVLWERVSVCCVSNRSARCLFVLCVCCGSGCMYVVYQMKVHVVCLCCVCAAPHECMYACVNMYGCGRVCVGMFGCAAILFMFFVLFACGVVLCVCVSHRMGACVRV